MTAARLSAGSWQQAKFYERHPNQIYHMERDTINSQTEQIGAYSIIKEGKN